MRVPGSSTSLLEFRLARMKGLINRRRKFSTSSDSQSSVRTDCQPEDSVPTSPESPAPPAAPNHNVENYDDFDPGYSPSPDVNKAVPSTPSTPAHTPYSSPTAEQFANMLVTMQTLAANIEKIEKQREEDIKTLEERRKADVALVKERYEAIEKQRENDMTTLEEWRKADVVLAKERHEKIVKQREEDMRTLEEWRKVDVAVAKERYEEYDEKWKNMQAELQYLQTSVDYETYDREEQFNRLSSEVASTREDISQHLTDLRAVQMSEADYAFRNYVRISDRTEKMFRSMLPNERLGDLPRRHLPHSQRCTQHQHVQEPSQSSPDPDPQEFDKGKWPVTSFHKRTLKRRREE